MIVRVLGCSGGEAPGRRATSVLLGERLLVDAGSAASTLVPAEQSRIDCVLLTHAHLDHVKDLPFLADTRVLDGVGPLRVCGTASTLALVHEHLLNDRIYPDWTRIPAASPAIAFEAVAPGRAFHAAGCTIEAVPLEHPGGSVAYAIDGASGSWIWAGDTGPAPALRAAVAQRSGRVRALGLEVSMPDRMEPMARMSGHLTPAMLRAEIEALGPARPEIWVHHLKPGLRDEILRELETLRLPGVRVLEEGDRIEIDLEAGASGRTGS